MSFAASRVYPAVDTKIRADGTLQTLLGGDMVYVDGEQPEGADFEFVTLGASDDGADDTYGRDGNDGSLMIGVRGHSKKTVLTICEHLNRLLHGVILTISGHVHIDGELSLLTDYRDPGTSGAHNATLRYRAVTQVAV